MSVPQAVKGECVRVVVLDNAASMLIRDRSQMGSFPRIEPPSSISNS